ncbi:MAG: hypothetical protein H0V62_04340 [Gammaproteobacteria bacterium]|nr:hypothetical protein [Gammaproteobacteria bacterium]
MPESAERAFQKFRRVLKPGGVALLLEITPPASPASQICDSYDGAAGTSRP